MVAAAAVAPSALISRKVGPSISSGSIDYRAQAKEQLAEWMSQKWSESIYEAVTRKSYFPIFTGGVGKYDNVIVRLK
jgi:hypothetical protein